MKKLLFLFTTLLLISCSSDENEESTQTFLEKYDGVGFLHAMTQQDLDTGLYGDYAAVGDEDGYFFSNTVGNEIMYVLEDSDVWYCDIDISGGGIDDNATIEIIENSATLVVKITEDDGYSMSLTFSVSDNILSVDDIEGGGFDWDFPKTDKSNPCD